MSVRRARAGATLLELLLVLALLGVILGVVGLAPGAADPRPAPDDTAAAIAAARQVAIRERRPISVDLPGDPGPAALTALPDGRVIADPVLPIDPLTARWSREP